MKRRSLLAAVSVLLAFVFLAGCGVRHKTLEELATAIPKEAAVVSQQSPGEKGAPIVVIEESHTSRLVQLENALVLTRLHNTMDLKRIALEGYLREQEQQIRFDQSVVPAILQGQSDVSRALSVSHLVREGDMNATEFMRLVYDDIQVTPAETADNYSSDTNIDNESTLYIVMARLALHSLDTDALKKVKTKSVELEKKYPGESDLGKGIIELTDFVIDQDPWTHDALNRLKDASLEKEIGIVNSVISRCQEKGVALPDSVRNRLGDYLEFLKKRDRASETIVESVSSLADRSDTPVVAVVIGSGHTERVSSLLKDAHRPFLVVTSLALENHDKNYNLSVEETQRRYGSMPVQSNSLNEILDGVGVAPVQESDEVKSNNPIPVINQVWLQSKVELYSATDSISGLLDPAVGAGGGGKFPPNIKTTFDNPSPGPDPKRLFLVLPPEKKRQLDQCKWIKIGDQIEVLATNSEGEPKEVGFEATLFPDDPQHRKKVYIRTRRTSMFLPRGSAAGRPPKTVEEVVQSEMDFVRSNKETDISNEEVAEGDKPAGRKPEPEKPEVWEGGLPAKDYTRVRISADTEAIIASSRTVALHVEMRD